MPEVPRKEPDGGDAGGSVSVDRDLVSRTIHDLRNGLNSLLMNVAVLSGKLPPADRVDRRPGECPPHTGSDETQPSEMDVSAAEQRNAQAVAALKQWQFEPGQLEGKPVAVRVTVDMTFTIR